jgi:type IV pilus assembly protein PilB
MEITPKISELIINNAPTETLQKTANEEGMIRMIQDGFIKAKTGITTIEEVLRVTKE